MIYEKYILPRFVMSLQFIISVYGLSPDFLFVVWVCKDEGKIDGVGL